MMNDAALCVFPWDLEDEGLDAVLGFAAGLGVTRLFLASVYHAGWFVLPHNPRRKAYMTEDGVAYFHPDPAQYASTPLKPQVARMVKLLLGLDTIPKPHDATDALAVAICHLNNGPTFAKAPVGKGRNHLPALKSWRHYRQ